MFAIVRWLIHCNYYLHANLSIFRSLVIWFNYIFISSRIRLFIHPALSWTRSDDADDDSYLPVDWIIPKFMKNSIVVLYDSALEYWIGSRKEVWQLPPRCRSNFVTWRRGRTAIPIHFLSICNAIRRKVSPNQRIFSISPWRLLSPSKEKLNNEIYLHQMMTSGLTYRVKEQKKSYVEKEMERRMLNDEK